MNELNKNNSQSLENKSENGFIESTNITCENEGKINKSGFNQTMRLDQNMSVDNGFMGKSLNNSFNMSCLNKTMCQDSTLSQSTILNNKNASTTPVQEKIIIKSLMKTEYGDTFSSGFHQENTGLLNQAKYIISASWWREWMQFVGFNDISNQMQQDCDTSMKRDRPKKLKNKCLLKIEQLYSFKNTKNVELKENLLEHYDYEAIPKSIFNYIKMWYGVDYEIIRFLKYDPSQPLEKSVYLDLYPEQTLACSLPMGIRKRQKNSTTTVVTSSNSNDRKENQSTLNNTNKTLTTKNSKQDKLNITDQNIQSETQLKSKEGTNESSNNQRVVKRRHHQSLDLDKINITLMDSKTDLNTKQQQENNDNKTIHTQRSIAENKSKACTIF